MEGDNRINHHPNNPQTNSAGPKGGEGGAEVPNEEWRCTSTSDRNGNYTELSYRTGRGVWPVLLQSPRGGRASDPLEPYA